MQRCFGWDRLLAVQALLWCWIHCPVQSEAAAVLASGPVLQQALQQWRQGPPAMPDQAAVLAIGPLPAMQVKPKKGRQHPLC